MAHFVLVNARSQLLEVIFFLVQTEAQYILDIINNIFLVGVVKWCSRFSSRDSVNGDLEILKSECYIRILSSAACQPCDIEAFLPGINFLNESGFSRS
jgi:hypothetical protein